MMRYLPPLEGKTALITGGGSGIGLASAKALAEAGANVAILGFSREHLEEAKDLWVEGLEKPYCIQADVSDCTQVERATADAVKALHGIDILIHSAAVTNRKPLLSMNNSEWERILAVNLNGAYYVGRSVAQQMISQKRPGSMVFITSTGAFRAAENFGAYSASKAGVIMMMKTLALELAPHRIRVNSIAPTATDTRFTADYYAANPGRKEAVAANHPLGRIAQPEDYTGTVLYLASDASAFVTGTVVVVDGGKTAK